MVVRNAYFVTGVHPQTGLVGASETASAGGLFGQEAVRRALGPYEITATPLCPNRPAAGKRPKPADAGMPEAVPLRHGRASRVPALK